MFVTSSHRKYWKFLNEQELVRQRLSHNQKFIEKHGQGMDDSQKLLYFLTPIEERLLLKQYELHLRDFCRRFDPQMPKAVIGTSFHYFKRFYLNNSPMDYHPRDILATCVYLACKVEEFNVSMEQFIGNIKGDRAKAINIILANEPLLMDQLNYYLIIHNPFRTVEGFMIDIKTRCSMNNPERLRPGIDEFLEKVFLTDAILLYAPSEIALAAVLHSASKEQENLDSYVTESLFYSAKEKLPLLIEAVRKIRSMVKSLDVPPKDHVKLIERKLDRCRNQANNPDSDIYKQRMKKLLEDDDDDIDIVDESEIEGENNLAFQSLNDSITL